MPEWFRKLAGSYAFYIEDLFRHASQPRVKVRRLWIPKGKSLFPEQGFPVTREEIS
jgi:hypothetical protein